MSKITFTYKALDNQGLPREGNIEALDKEDALRNLQEQGLQVTAIEQAKVGISKCPYCSEQIQADAKKCRHCGEWLDETSRTAKSGTSHVDANTIARGMVLKEGMDAVNKTGSVIILILSCFVGVWLNNFWVGTATFFLLFIPFSIWCYK